MSKRHSKIGEASMLARQALAARFKDQAVRPIFALFAAKRVTTLAGCAAELNAKGLRTRWRCEWTPNAVRRVLAAYGHTAKSLRAALVSGARVAAAPLERAAECQVKIFHWIDRVAGHRFATEAEVLECVDAPSLRQPRGIYGAVRARMLAKRGFA